MEIHKIERQKKRVAMIMDTWFPVHTGEQVYVARLASALSDLHGYEVDIFTRAIDGKLTAEQSAIESLPAIRIKRFGFKSHPWNVLMQIWFVFATFAHLIWAGKNYDVYHAHTATSATAMKLASWFTHVPTVLTVHGNNVFDYAWTLRKVIHRIMFLETKYTQEISVAENFLKAQNVNDPVLVIPYGVDTTAFDKVKEQKDPHQFNVLFVGRLDFVKGIDTLLLATQKVIESNGFIQSQKDFQLHLVGAGPDRKYFEGMARKLGISKYVKFHGLLVGEDLIHLYKSSDLFVLPSRSEALPFSVLEASASGLPILATNVGDLKKLVIENTNGHLIEPDDVAEMAYYLEYFAGNPHLESMGQASHDLVVQEYAWDTTVQKMLRVYESVMQKKATESFEKSEYLIPPLKLPSALWKSRIARKPYKGKNFLKFCFTLNLEHDSPEILPSEDSVFDAFLERMTEFLSQLDMPGTIFIQSNLIEAFANEIVALQEGGHEIGVKLLKSEWLTGPIRKKAIREVRETLTRIGIKNVRMLHAPGEIIDEELEYAHENGFEYLPVSRDPDPQIIWKFLLPFGKSTPMDLSSFLALSDEALLTSINRLRSFQKHYGMEPFIIFECSNEDFTSGENFTGLSKKLALLREEMEIKPMTLSVFCESCRL
ncbi:MAG: glycosyltransferase [Candidatus Gracilibacteria bacterium]